MARGYRSNLNEGSTSISNIHTSYMIRDAPKQRLYNSPSWEAFNVDKVHESSYRSIMSSGQRTNTPSSLVRYSYDTPSYGPRRILTVDLFSMMFTNIYLCPDLDISISMSDEIQSSVSYILVSRISLLVQVNNDTLTRDISLRVLTR